MNHIFVFYKSEFRQYMCVAVRPKYGCMLLCVDGGRQGFIALSPSLLLSHSVSPFSPLCIPPCRCACECVRGCGCVSAAVGVSIFYLQQLIRRTFVQGVVLTGLDCCYRGGMWQREEYTRIATTWGVQVSMPNIGCAEAYTRSQMWNSTVSKYNTGCIPCTWVLLLAHCIRTIIVCIWFGCQQTKEDMEYCSPFRSESSE
jgi:hypothetical protein